MNTIRPVPLLLALISLTGGARFAAAGEPAAETFELTKDEQAIVDRTNEERKAAGLAELKVSEALTKAARSHSENMARLNRLAHELGGQGPGERARAQGYAFRGLGENCAAGQRNPAEAVGCWMRSAGHRANLLGGYGEVGVAVATAADGTKYWTQVFATPAGR